jgi:predicted nucleic acid-binding protein
VIYFLDASALAKRYIAEQGSERVRQLFRRRAAIAVSRVSEVEVASALVRRAGAGDIEPAMLEAHLESLLDDLAGCDVVEIRKPVIAHARELVCEHGLRAYDGVQLACALRARTNAPLTLWCADGELATAAETEGLRVERLRR